MPARPKSTVEQILAPNKNGDVVYFGCSSYALWPPLPAEQAPQLRNWKHWDPLDEQDASPNAEWFVQFTQRFKGRCWLIGYRVGDKREDVRVSIEGIIIAADDLTKGAHQLLMSKEPDEMNRYEPGRSNNLDIAIIRYWWD